MMLHMILLATVAAGPSALAPHTYGDVAAADASTARYGVLGHRVIARVAAARISPLTRTRLQPYLGAKTLAEVSTWGDEIRGQRPSTGPWHYVNIPVTDSIYRQNRHCPNQCIIKALEAQLRVLENRTTPRAARAEALKWVVHLVGDLHVPTHVGDRGDRGGNDLQVRYGRRRLSLHSFWDGPVLQSMGLSENALVSRIEQRIRSRSDATAIASGSVTRWAMETHGLARDIAYRRLPDNLVIGDDYVAVAHPVAEELLLRAGVRLAALLDRAFRDG
jgi:hypothetical protein